MRIRVLGGLEINSRSGEPVRLPTRKASLLLAALVLARRRSLRREVLCEAFWPDREDMQARGSLRQALVAIRRPFPEGSVRIEGGPESVELMAEPEDVDVWCFEQLIQKDDPTSLAAAADLYRGDLLAGIAVQDPLDQWFEPHRRSYRSRALQLAEQLSLLAASGQKSAEAPCERLAERLLAGDPTAEEAHRALIRIYRHHGRENAAVRQFGLCKEALQRELGVEPEARTHALMAERRSASFQAGEFQGTGTTATASPAAPPATRRDRDQPSVVIMPFDNLSGAADEFFVDGVVEEITATLSRVRDFFVIARQSAFSYKGRFVDIREVGTELGVRYAVEGTVRRAGDRVRISVQLVDTDTRAQLWSGRYEGATADIFEFQDSIAAQVAGAIHPAVLRAEIDAAKRKPPGSLRAYERVLQAYPMIWSAVAHENTQAIGLLMDAIAADPKYGRAHALLAWCHSQAVVYLWSADPEVDREAARTAIAAASGLINDPMALTAVGAALSQCLGDHDRAAACIEGALALDPNSAWAWARYAWLALYCDQPNQARERFERALMLSPLDPLEFNFRIGIAVAAGVSGDYAQAARMMREVLNKHPEITWAYRQLASFAALAGDLRTARDAVDKLLSAHPNASVALMKTSHPLRHLPRVFGLMLEGWRLAGLPEN